MKLQRHLHSHDRKIQIRKAQIRNAQVRKFQILKVGP